MTLEIFKKNKKLLLLSFFPSKGRSVAMKSFHREHLHKYSSRVKSGQPVAREDDVDGCKKLVEGEGRSQFEASAVPKVLWSPGVTMEYTTVVVGADAKSDVVARSLTTVVHHPEQE